MRVILTESRQKTLAKNLAFENAKKRKSKNTVTVNSVIRKNRRFTKRNVLANKLAEAFETV